MTMSATQKDARSHRLRVTFSLLWSEASGSCGAATEALSQPRSRGPRGVGAGVASRRGAPTHPRSGPDNSERSERIV